MSSAGHILDMINRIKQNKVPRRKKFRATDRDPIHSEKFDRKTEYKFPKASDRELKTLSIGLRKKNSKNNRRSLFLFLVLFIAVSCLFWLVINKVNLIK